MSRRPIRRGCYTSALKHERFFFASRADSGMIPAPSFEGPVHLTPRHRRINPLFTKWVGVCAVAVDQTARGAAG